MAGRPPPKNDKKILITGLNGYIASNLAIHFLALGYNVVGTVRDPSQASQITDSSAFQPYIRSIAILSVSDITQPSSFDEVLKDVHAIFHLATPVNFWSAKKKAIFDPAVNGTLNLLRAAHERAGPSLRTFVYISSLAALLDPKNPSSHHYDADSWNHTAEVAAAKLGDDDEAPFSILYPASKISAERAILHFRDTVRPAFRIVSVVTAMVIGAPALLPERVEDMPGTIRPIWEVFNGECEAPRKVGSGMFVYVKDLVCVCSALVERDVGRDGGRDRVVVVGGRAEPSAMVRALRERYSERSGYLKDAAGTAESDWPESDWPTFDTKEAESLLGRRWTAYENSVIDTARALERYLI